MDAYVVKVQFEESLRRLPLERGDLAFSFAQLVTRTKDLFQIPATAQLLFTYTDSDGDVVTMAEDHDLRDALVTQALNPLRLNLAILSGEAKATTTDVKMNDSTADLDSGKTPQELENKNETEPQAGNGDAAAAAVAVTPRDENPRVSEQVVHKGVTCDECGMTPITGPRYKSTTMDDYDLCRDCFEKPDVDPSEYIKIKRGRPDRRSVHFGRGIGHRPGHGHGPGHGIGHGPGHGIGHGPGHGIGHGPRGERGGRHHKHGMNWKDCSGRACENGRAERQGGEAVHHGVECDECKITPIVGPRYKSERQFNYDLCQNCYQSVASASSSEDYARIDRPVRYMPRYYHLASPFSFYRFSPYGRPFCGRRIRRIMVTTVGEEEEEQRRAQRTGAGKNSDAEKSAAQEARVEAPAASADVRMGEQEGQAGAAIADHPEAAAGAAEVTMIEVGGDGEKTQTAGEAVGVEQQQQEQQAGTESAMAGAAAGDVSHLPHEGMVEKLAALGFNDGQLNEELLRKNNFDLRTTLEDLRAVKNWEPLLKELEEMGFPDSELNKRLLAQNDGNVRAVVRELVRLTKQQVDAGEKQARVSSTGRK